MANYRIDLVVEGMRGRLAVECDGDAWHGPEQQEHDNARQRQLERCGWEFVRIRGSEFYRDRSQALEPLWKTLERPGIEPGLDTAAPFSTVEQPISGAESDSDDLIEFVYESGLAESVDEEDAHPAESERARAGWSSRSRLALVVSRDF